MVEGEAAFVSRGHEGETHQCREHLANTISTTFAVSRHNARSATFLTKSLFKCKSKLFRYRDKLIKVQEDRLDVRY